MPKKLLIEIKGKPIISHMLDRLKMAKKIDDIIICTSNSLQDRPLVDLAIANGVSHFYGDPDDVIARLYGASEEYNLDYVLNITADCPFVDPIYADKIVDAFMQTDADLIRAFDLPHGAFSYGIRPEALKKVIEIKDSNETEVWGRYFTDTDLFDVYDMPIENPFHRRPNLRMTLDYPEDLLFFETVFDYLYSDGRIFSLDEILNLLDEHSEIVEINRHCANLFRKHFNAQAEVQLKPRYRVSKAAIIGCGSIGQRHIKNLQELGITDMVTLRSGKGHFKDLPSTLGVQEMHNWDELFSENPDIAVVCNPTGLHVETVDRLLPHVKGIFIEKPLSDSLVGVKALLERIKAHKVVSFVGYNLQFHAGVRAMKDILNSGEIGEPLLFQCQVGNWLPDWHPYEDYRKAYYARKDLGGGVTLTMIHEIHLAHDLLGVVEGVYCFFKESETLPLEVDTIADLMIRHTSGAVSQIHLDFIQRPLHRCGVISCEKGWIQYDLVNPLVIVQFADQPSPQIVWAGADYDMNQQYIDEMDTFLRYVREGRMRHAFDAWGAVSSLAVADEAFASAESGCLSELPAWVHTLG